MKDTLVRFGVAMEQNLLVELDRLVSERGGTRSELLRDLVRAEVTRARVSDGTHAVASLTLVYDHHVRDLTEKLTEFQHSLGEKVNSVLHVHLDHDHCLEVVVMRGQSNELKRAAEKLLATRGVKHGGIELIAVEPPSRTHSHVHRHGSGPPHSHPHSHPLGEHDHDHHHGDAHGHEHPKKRAAAPKGKTRSTRGRRS